MFIVFGLALLLAIAELAARAVSYQLRGEYPFALEEAWKRGWAPSSLRVAQEIRDQTAPLYREGRESLTTEVGGELLVELEARYEREFTRFVADVCAAGSKLFVLNFLSARDSPHGAFIADLVARHGVDYLDISERFNALPRGHTMLLPHDYHLTRYGNTIVAEALADHLRRYRECSSGREYAGSSAVLGDFPATIGLPAGIRWKSLAWNPLFGFTVAVNAQGFRNSDDLATTKKKVRVLCIGDSYTFGIHVNTVDTFPAIVERLRPGLEMINAGISGYTISDEASLFAESAVRAAPDVTILQVCDNDLFELTAWSQNLFGRVGRGSYQASPVEQRYFDEMRRRLAERAAAETHRAETR